jgi:hypothetical protein
MKRWDLCWSALAVLQASLAVTAKPTPKSVVVNPLTVAERLVKKFGAGM